MVVLKSLIPKSLLTIVVTALILIFIVAKSFNYGMDFNVYLFASKQFFNSENIYGTNPYNQYLYSPLFALILRPLSIFDFSYARVIWALLNFALIIRLWKISSFLVQSSIPLNKLYNNYFKFGMVIISIGFLILNLNLGQITIVILWLTLEGLFQVLFCKNTLKGAGLLALGINIKIIPLLGLYFLFFKGKYKAVAICLGLVIVSLFLPSLFVGHNYNMKQLSNWGETINPSSNKFVFENGNLTQSLNAIIPAYFYDFEDVKVNNEVLKRKIISVSHNNLVAIMQLTRIALVLSILFLIFYRKNERNCEPIYFYWEFAYLALVSTLIFPHQQKYAMLYFVPAGSYMVLFLLLSIKAKWEISFKEKVTLFCACFLLLISASFGRDIMGDYLVNILDYYHLLGLINLCFLSFLLLIKPNALIRLNNLNNHVGS